MWNIIKLPCLIIVTLILGAHQSDVIDKCYKSRMMISMIDKAIDFLEQNYKDINLDGFVAFEFLGGFLGDILAKNLSNNCGITPKINQIQRRLSILNKNSLPIISRNDPEYVAKLRATTEILVQFQVDWRRLHPRVPSTEELIKDNYQESEGDDCFQELSKGNCTISEKCSHTFLSNDKFKGYAATHAVLYLIIYKMQCSKSTSNRLPGTNLEKRINDYCFDILQENISLLKKESRSIASDLDIFMERSIASDLDIFMERIVICGGKLGFVEFFSEAAFDVALLSQDRESGCTRENAYLYNIQSQPSESDSLDRRISLRKRMDAVMKDGCGSHLFGLGAAGYGAFLKYFLSQYTIKNI